MYCMQSGTSWLWKSGSNGLQFAKSSVLHYRDITVQKLIALYLHRHGRLALLAVLEPRYMGMAAEVHIFGEGYFRRHDQDHFYQSAFFERQLSPQQGAARAEILSTTGAGAAFGGYSQENRNLICEALSAAALDPVLPRIRHSKQSSARKPLGEAKRSGFGRRLQASGSQSRISIVTPESWSLTPVA